MRRDRRAYSTFELLIALSIIGLTTAIAAPRYFSSVRRSKLERAAALVASDLTRARDNARAFGFDQTVAFSTERYSITTRTAAGTTSKTINLTKDPFENAVAALRTGAANSVTFNQYGMPSNTIVIALRSGTVIRVLQVSEAGEVTLLDAAPAQAAIAANITDSAITAAYAAPVGPD